MEIEDKCHGIKNLNQILSLYEELKLMFPNHQMIWVQLKTHLVWLESYQARRGPDHYGQ